jgi:hypothetical protein
VRRWLRAAPGLAATMTLLAVAAQATAAPTITTPLSCWLWNEPSAPQSYPVYGTGFPALTPLEVGVAGGDLQTSVRTGSAGNFSAMVPRSASWTGIPVLATAQAFELSAAQPPPPPRLLASLQVAAVYQSSEVYYPYRFPTFAPLSTPITTIWGGWPGATVYVHYFYTRRWRPIPNRLMGTFTLGTLTGPCGGLDVSFPAFGRIHARAGYWLVAIDMQKRISPGTGDGIAFEVMHWSDIRPRPRVHPHSRRLVILNY